MRRILYTNTPHKIIQFRGNRACIYPDRHDSHLHVLGEMPVLGERRVNRLPLSRASHNPRCTATECLIDARNANQLTLQIVVVECGQHVAVVELARHDRPVLQMRIAAWHDRAHSCRLCTSFAQCTMHCSTTNARTVACNHGDRNNENQSTATIPRSSH